MPSAQLLPSEFDTHIEQGTLRLALVGMSNCGKSFRSRVLRDERDFSWYHVDGMICDALGFSSVTELPEWMGFPTTEGYVQREREYLDLENRFTKQAAVQTNGQNLVFDTTGSVVHLEPETLETLRENCLVVHFDVGEDTIPQMLERFFQTPKPVSWCGYFTQMTGESLEDALRRCYPTLLHDRLSMYRKLAHVTVPAACMFDATADETLQCIREQL